MTWCFIRFEVPESTNHTLSRFFARKMIRTGPPGPCTKELVAKRDKEGGINRMSPLAHMPTTQSYTDLPPDFMGQAHGLGDSNDTRKRTGTEIEIQQSH